MCTTYAHTCNVRVRMQYSGNYEIVEAITPPLSRLNVRLWELKNELIQNMLLHLSEFAIIVVSLYKHN